MFWDFISDRIGNIYFTIEFLNLNQKNIYFSQKHLHFLATQKIPLNFILMYLKGNNYKTNHILEIALIQNILDFQQKVCMYVYILKLTKSFFSTPMNKFLSRAGVV